MPKKVFVSGCYDMLHSGHVAFFEEAAKLETLSEKEALSLVSEIREKGGTAMAVKADVSNETEVSEMMKKISENVLLLLLSWDMLTMVRQLY